MSERSIVIFINPPNTGTIPDDLSAENVTTGVQHTDWANFPHLGILSLASYIEKNTPFSSVYMDGVVCPVADMASFITENRVSLYTGRPVWPGHHWIKSKQVCREMERELGLKRPTPKRAKRLHASARTGKRQQRRAGRYDTLKPAKAQLHKLAAIKQQKWEQAAKPTSPKPLTANTKGWPPKAVADWELWGHRNPPRFFKLWPELSI